MMMILVLSTPLQRSRAPKTVIELERSSTTGLVIFIKNIIHVSFLQLILILILVL